MIPIPDSTKRTAVVQLIRSGVQWLMGVILAVAIVDMAIEALGVDPGTARDAISLVLELVLFLAYIGVVRLLEHLHPALGWLNGWPASISYQGTRSQR